MAPALHLDENVDPEIARRLRADGYDIVTTQQAGRKGAADEDQLAYAASQDRVLFTHDIQDFGSIAIRWSIERRDHAGIYIADGAHRLEYALPFTASLNCTRPIDSGTQQ